MSMVSFVSSRVDPPRPGRHGGRAHDAAREAARTMKSRAAPPRLGRREQSKVDKRARIQRAAWDLFTTVGYEETTTREVAERADVAVGTLFLYAEDKRDLL